MKKSVNMKLTFSRHRVTLKKRYGLLLTQQSTYKPKQIEAKPETEPKTNPEFVKVKVEPKKSKH